MAVPDLKVVRLLQFGKFNQIRRFPGIDLNITLVIHREHIDLVEIVIQTAALASKSFLHHQLIIFERVKVKHPNRTIAAADARSDEA